MKIFKKPQFFYQWKNIDSQTNKKTNINSFGRILVALLGSTGLQVVVQIATVPIMLHYLGIEKYSIWLVAMNLSQIAIILDLGTLASTQYTLTFLEKTNQTTRMRNHIKQFWNIILTSYSITFLFGIILGLLTDFPIFLTFIFLISNLIQVAFGMYEGLTRTQNKVANGLNSSSIIRLMDFLGILLGLLLFPKSIIWIAITSLTLKITAAFLMLFRIDEKMKFLFFGQFNMDEITDLLKEGFPFLLTRLAEFFMLNGTLLILQLHFSAVEIVLFSTSRTFFRLGLQITSLINHAYSYEMSSAWAEKDLAKLRTLVRKSQVITIYLSSMGFFVYLTVGTFFYKVWTHQSIDISFNLLILGSLYSIVLSISQGQSTKFNAINLNLRVSFVQFSISIMLLLITMCFGTSITVYRMFFLLFVSEILILLLVWIITRNIISKNFEQ